MTVPSSATRNAYVADGSVAADGSATFAFTFACQDAAHILVRRDGLDTSTGFFVFLREDQAANPGGTVTFYVGPPAGTAIEIRRRTPSRQGVTLPAYAPFPAKTIEAALDRATMVDQEIQAQLDEDIADVRAQEAADIADVRATHAADIAAVRSEHAQDVAALTDQHFEGVATLRAERLAADNDLAAAHATDVAAVRNEHASDVAALREEHDQDVFALEQEIADARSKIIQAGDAHTLEGHPAADFRLVSDAVDAATLGGKTPAQIAAMAIPAWAGVFQAAYGNGDPELWASLGLRTGVGGQSVTPTALTNTVARCVRFTVPAAITVRAIRAVVAGTAVATAGAAAIYPAAGGAALWQSGIFGTTGSAAGTWRALPGTFPFTLPAGDYWLAVGSGNVTGANSPFLAPAGPAYAATFNALPWRGLAGMGLAELGDLSIVAGVPPATLTPGAVAAMNASVTQSSPWLLFLDSSA